MINIHYEVQIAEEYIKSALNNINIICYLTNRKSKYICI